MSDLISRADAIEAVRKLIEEPRRYYTQYNNGIEHSVKALSALPSADAVSMEEHIKELNDLAVEWKANYDETMAKVAKECEECKERLRNIRQSAEAEPCLKAIKRQIDEHWHLDPPSAEAVQGECGMIPIELKKRYPYSRDEDITDAFMRGYQAHGEAVQGDAISKRFISDAILQKISELNAQGEKAIPIAREFIRFKRFVDGLTPIRTEAVQGWIPCSERLPKKGEVVLITNGKGNVRCGQYRSEYDVRGETHYWWWKGKTVESVLAWMPLPTPYKGGGSE